MSEERVTVIRFAGRDKTASIFTTSQRVLNCLLKAGLSPVKVKNGWLFAVEREAVLLRPYPYGRLVRIGGWRRWPRRRE